MQAQGKTMISQHPTAIYMQIPTHIKYVCALIPDKHNPDDDLEVVNLQ